jgi:hypothetical protein
VSWVPDHCLRWLHWGRCEPLSGQPFNVPAEKRFRGNFDFFVNLLKPLSKSFQLGPVTVQAEELAIVAIVCFPVGRIGIALVPAG